MGETATHHGLLALDAVGEADARGAVLAARDTATWPAHDGVCCSRTRCKKQRSVLERGSSMRRWLVSPDSQRLARPRSVARRRGSRAKSIELPQEICVLSLPSNSSSCPTSSSDRPAEPSHTTHRRRTDSTITTSRFDDAMQSGHKSSRRGGLCTPRLVLLAPLQASEPRTSTGTRSAHARS
jgi:hypothetical protein